MLLIIAWWHVYLIIKDFALFSIWAVLNPNKRDLWWQKVLTRALEKAELQHSHKTSLYAFFRVYFQVVWAWIVPSTTATIIINYQTSPWRCDFVPFLLWNIITALSPIDWNDSAVCLEPFWTILVLMLLLIQWLDKKNILVYNTFYPEEGTSQTVLDTNVRF